MAIQFIPVSLPSNLVGQSNGKLGPCQLKPYHFAGVGDLSLHTLAADAFGAMSLVCLSETGFTLSVSSAADAYRSYDQQVRGFTQRMSAIYNPITCTTTTRTWNGKKYWLKRGYAPVATPGTSNHGWGLAIDTAVYAYGKDAQGVFRPMIQGITVFKQVWDWVQENAVDFGFSWEGAKPGTKGWEPWHLRYVTGDQVPARVKAVQDWIAAASVNK